MSKIGEFGDNVLYIFRPKHQVTYMRHWGKQCFFSLMAFTQQSVLYRLTTENTWISQHHMHRYCTITFKEQGSHNNVHRLQLWQLWVNVYQSHVKKSVEEETQYYWTTKIMIQDVVMLLNGCNPKGSIH